MIIEKFLIRSFADQQHKSEYPVKVPLGAKFLNVLKVLHDGIYGFYAVSEVILSLEAHTVDRFKILQPGESIPDEETADLIDILDIIFEVPPEKGQDNNAEPTQGMMLFPVYKIKEQGNGS